MSIYRAQAYGRNEESRDPEDSQCRWLLVVSCPAIGSWGFEANRAFTKANW